MSVLYVPHSPNSAIPRELGGRSQTLNPKPETLKQVIGETASIGHHCYVLHGVTLGATGKTGDFDRHPKVPPVLLEATDIYIYIYTYINLYTYVYKYVHMCK